MSVIQIEHQNYDELVSEGIVLVDFYAEWCGPCKMLGPALEALANERADVKIIKVNIDEQEELTQRFGIMSVPTLLLYKDGVNISQKNGFQTLDMLNSWIDESIK
ncbi:MAG TPA: thioredoxin [Mollicutes bacterium]|nr:thioredoxin [Mollicutes bacterium]